MVGLNKQAADNGILEQLESPTPQEIQEMTAEIRSNWSPRMRRRRRVEAHKYVGLIEMPLLPTRKGTFED